MVWASKKATTHGLITDHITLLNMQQDIPRKYNYVSRFEDRWSTYFDCEEVISTAWQGNGNQLDGLGRIQQKLAGYMRELKKWSKENEYDSKGRLTQKFQILQDLQQ